MIFLYIVHIMRYFNQFILHVKVKKMNNGDIVLKNILENEILQLLFNCGKK